MKHIQQYTAEDVMESPRQTWVSGDDVEALIKRFPKGMEHCTFKLLECEKGHRRLTATNWIDNGCPTCAQEQLREELEDMRAKAIAAVWLIPEDENISGLQQLAKEAREVLSGKDKKTIANLQDELANAQEALRRGLHPERPGVNQVFGLRYGESLRYALMIASINHAPNGGLEIEVYIP